MNAAVTSTDLPGVPVRHGKVRDVYDFGDRLLLVATDRVSVFDHVLPTGIPDKGRVLTQISNWWFRSLDEHGRKPEHHLISDDPTDVDLPSGVDVESLRGRSMVVRKTEVLPVECVARGYLAGSGWKEYQRTQTVCGLPLGPGLHNAAELAEPIFTPATKADEGHDENIDFARCCDIVGFETAETLREYTLELYGVGKAWARDKGIIIADTKFEFGRDVETGEIILIDEVMTPDSSRFWPADSLTPELIASGKNPPSFDKQFVRDWAESTGWDKESAPPEVPADVVEQTRSKYIEAFELLTGQTFAWR